MTFTDAFQLHAAGRLAEAEAAYRALLAVTPDDTRVMHNFGLLCAQRGNLEEGLSLIRRAIALKPDFAEAHFSAGNTLFALDRLEDAAQSFASAAEFAPRHVEAILNLGSVLQELRRYDEALAACERALAVAPDHPGALNNRGNTLRLMGRPDEALADFDRAIAHAPDYALAHFNRASVLDALGRTDDALAACRRALSLAPRHAPAHHLHGTILLARDRHAEALAAFDLALGLQPAMIEALHGRTRALLDLTRWEEALANSAEALARDPGSAVAHNNRGAALLKFRRYDEARAALDRAIEIEPNSADGYFNRSGLYYQQNRLDEALADADAAVQRRPDFAEAVAFRFNLAAHLCDWQGRTEEIDKIVQFCRHGRKLEVFPLMYATDDPQLHLMAARRVAVPVKPPLARTAVIARKRLRVAYISADFRDHPVSHQAAELFESHDRGRVELYGISLWPASESPVRQRLKKAFVQFVDAHERSDIDIARRLADMQIDIAVDLGGYTDRARPEVLAYRPAPVTVSYLGYPGTLGTAFIDYIMADGRTIPPEDDRYYAEKVVRLPGCFMPRDATTCAAPAVPARAEERLPQQGFVFADFNKTDKITPEVFDLWMGILKAVPQSVLWLNVQNATARRHLRAEAQSRQVDPERLVFAERTAQRADHLARLALADLFLDTLPYNAHATASDFLCQGVPVLTCAGRTFASRVSASLLEAAGVPELVAPSLTEYEAAALELVRDRPKLAALRDRLVRARDARDSRVLARNIETAYFTMWERRLRGLPPESFTVPV
jgi:predicted O-linked N-acetylglucosamine transferase (SPINDLY family)